MIALWTPHECTYSSCDGVIIHNGWSEKKYPWYPALIRSWIKNSDKEVTAFTVRYWHKSMQVEG